MSASTAADAPSRVLWLDAAGTVRAWSGEGEGDCPPELLALVRRALASGQAEEDLVSLRSGGEWQASAVPGRDHAGQAVCALLLRPSHSDTWSRTGLVETEKHSALCRLVSGMVHELRNPLASISLTAELLAMRSATTPEAAEKLHEIVHHVERAEEVLQSLRRFGREEQTAMRLHSLNDLVSDAARLERALVVAKGAQLQLDLDPELPEVLADPSQLRLVIANLIRNSAEAMAQEGKPGKIFVRTSHRHGVIRLTVEDEGPGITPERLPRLFEPYFTTKPDGTGLGLPLSLGIVKAHGGHLWAENRRRRGARFLADLPDPRHSTPAQQLTALGVELTQGPTHSALVVDPDPDRMEALRRAIASMGWKVHVAPSNAVALRKLAAADFDLVLVAGEVDDGSPLELLGRARVTSPELAGRAIVLLPEAPSDELSRRLQSVGANVAVGPPSPALLQYLAQTVMGRRR